MKKFEKEEFPPRLLKIADDIAALVNDLKFNREYSVIAPEAPVMYIGGNLENAERNIRLVYFYFESLMNLRK